MTIADLKAAVAIDTNIPPELQVYFLNGDILADGSKTLEAAGLHENDILLMQVRRVQPPRAQLRRRRLRDDAELLRLQALGEPRVLNMLRQHKPELADAVQDSGRFREIWNRLTQEQEEAEAEKERIIARLNADPFDAEAQKKIEEMIRENAVMQNLTDTMENNPEGMFSAIPVNEHQCPPIMKALGNPSHIRFKVASCMCKSRAKLLTLPSFRQGPHALHSCRS